MKEYKRSQRIFGCLRGFSLVLVGLLAIFYAPQSWAKYSWYPAKTWIWHLGSNYFYSSYNMLGSDRENFAERLKIHQVQIKLSNYYQFNNHLAAMLDLRAKYVGSHSDLATVGTIDRDRITLNLMLRPFYGNTFFYPTFFAEGVLNICCSSNNQPSGSKVLFSSQTNELALGSAFTQIFQNWTTYLDLGYRFRQPIEYSNTFENRLIVSWRPSKFIGAFGLTSFVEVSPLIANKYPGVQQNLSSFYSIEKNKFAWAGKVSFSIPLGAGLGLSFWYAQNILGAGVAQQQGGGIDLFLLSSLGGKAETQTRNKFVVE